MKDITYNPIWNSNKYICGFIEADFLHFAGNDKSNFQDDEELNDFIETIEEKIEPKLIEAINKIKSKGEKEKINKMVENIKNALSKTLKDLGINPWGEGERKKKCPSCEKEHPYNQQVCHECGYEWPTSTKTCKFCNKNIPSASKICPECKTRNPSVCAAPQNASPVNEVVANEINITSNLKIIPENCS